MARIVFLHGLEGSATGSKPTWLKEHGHDVTAPILDTSALIAFLSRGDGWGEGLIAPPDVLAKPRAAAADALASSAPDVVVGSSFGGGLAMDLWQSGAWRGPLVLLAPAGRKLFGIQRLTTSTDSTTASSTTPPRIAILHGRRDDIVPVDDSFALCAACPGDVTLRVVDDDHRLLASVAAGLMGALVDLVLRD